MRYTVRRYDPTWDDAHLADRYGSGPWWVVCLDGAELDTYESRELAQSYADYMNAREREAQAEGMAQYRTRVEQDGRAIEGSS
jgi:hypothetical protein